MAYQPQSNGKRTFLSRLFGNSIGEFIFWISIIVLVRTFGFGLYQVPTGSMETTMLVGERFFADKLTYLFRSPRHSEIISFNQPKFRYSSNPLKKIFENYFWGPENWTKRLIGVPGDVVEGKIEDGKPVVYRNGEKLNEPYVNKYPLIGIYDKDQKHITADVERELNRALLRGQIRPSDIEQAKAYYLEGCMHPRSYDPSVPYDKQPFYRFTADQVAKNKEGEPVLKWPTDPLPQRGDVKEVKDGENHWNGTDEYYVKLGNNQYWAMGDNRKGSHDCRFFGPLSGSMIHGRILFCIWSMDSSYSWWIVHLLTHPIDFFQSMRWSRCLKWLN